MSQLPEYADSLQNCLAFSARDWSLDKRDAWVWGIICGWDEAALTDLAVIHRWPMEEVQRLRDLRQQYCLSLIPNTFLTTVASKTTAIISRLSDINRGSDKACNIARELKKEAFDLIKRNQT